MDMKIFTVPLPDIGEGVVEGEVLSWLKQEGETLRKDEPVVVVMTDKATVELPAPYPGTLAKQYYKPGEIAIKDRPLYDISLAEGVVPITKQEHKRKVAAATAAEEPEIARPSRPCSVARAATQEGALATPATRHLAKQLGVDLHAIRGSGEGGRILPHDLRGTVAPQAQKPSTPVPRLEGDTETPLMGFRRAIAEKMVESSNTIPHFSYFEQVDATRLIQLRENLKKRAEQEGIKLTYTPFLIRALSLTLNLFPEANSAIDPHTQTVVSHKKHNISLAMNGPNGLVVPVLKDAQDLSLEGIIRAFEALKARTLQGKVTPQEMQDGTITITNFGTLGGNGVFATPIINYPQAAILGVARIQPQPVVVQREVVVRDVLSLSWSFDHRLIDGDKACALSKTFCELVANPSRLL